MNETKLTLSKADAATLRNIGDGEIPTEVVKRCKVLFKGSGGAVYGYGATASAKRAPGTVPSRFAWTIVGPDVAVRSRYAITVLS